MNIQQHHDNVANVIKHTIDTVAGVGVLGSILGYLPGIAAGFAIIWYCIQIYTWWRTRKNLIPVKED